MKRAHFNHEHPMMLIEFMPKSEGEEEDLCYGCSKPILGSAYSCTECRKTFLHKKCAGLPRTIKHLVHHEHPLTLFPKSPYIEEPNECKVCHTTMLPKQFTYRCSKCEFDIHVSCALKQGVIKHESHDHPLAYMHRTALFHCDACGVEEKDFSYRCTICPFWIHKSCASLPSIMQSGDHNHRLVLSLCLPDANRRFKQYCEICSKKVDPVYWIYYCAGCRYFAHIKCAMSKKQPSRMSRNHAHVKPTTSEGRGGTKSNEDLYPDLIHLPMSDDSLNLVPRSVESSFEENDSTILELTRFRHDHPLILVDVQTNDIETKNDEMICDGCVRPISVPFYSCEQCNFFLHKSCAQLPRILEVPCHPEHRLMLTFDVKFKLIRCGSCGIYNNGLTYKCHFESCGYSIDVTCGRTLLPRTIKHEAHKDPMEVRLNDGYYLTSMFLRDDSELQCSACGGHSINIKYECIKCKFRIDHYCARLPATVSHRWDRHPISLTYPPFYDHPEDFYCEICEEEINPKYWLYHCRLCDQSFHPQCVHPFDEYSNVKFGGTHKLENDHPHPLTFVRKDKNKSPSLCHRCGKNVIAVLECAPCNFLLCTYCARVNRPTRL